MPANSKIRTDPAGKTAKFFDGRQVVAVFAYPGIYDLGRVCDQMLAPASSRGRKSPYPAAVFIALLVCVRIVASLPETIKALRAQYWSSCCDMYAEMTDGETLPLAAPNRDQVQHFRAKLLTRPDVLAALQREFQTIAVAQARHLGNLRADQPPNWADPDQRNLVFGDGTVLAPCTDVVRRVHPLTGQKYAQGSRAKSAERARVQQVHSDLEPDQKTHLRGVNFVSLHTWTPYGRVTLGTGAALRAEQWTALDLLDAVAELAQGGVHTLLYDRVFTGWLVDYCMARHRIQVTNKAVGAARTTGEPGDGLPRASETHAHLTSDEHLLREAAEAHVELAPPDLAYGRDDLRADLFYSGRPQPLGLCLYPNLTEDDVADLQPGDLPTRRPRGYETVYSRYFDLGVHTHSTPDGECAHQLFVDDGALHIVDNDPGEGHLVKVGTAQAVRSEPTGNDQGWGSRTTWDLPCASGTWQLTTHWTPDPTRYHRGDQRPNPTKQQRALSELRPISRSDHVRFTRVANRRNLAESFNAWLKNTMPVPGRAASLTLAGQELDVLTAAVLGNALTWARAEAE